MLHEQALSMRDTLGYVAETFGVPVPGTVLAALENHRATRLERVQYEIVVKPPSEHSATLKFWYHYGQFRRLNELYQNENPLMRFPVYLRDTWMLPTTRDVPGHMVRFSTNWLSRRIKPVQHHVPEDGA
jgi:hypothetical protein